MNNCVLVYEVNEKNIIARQQHLLLKDLGDLKELKGPQETSGDIQDNRGRAEGLRWHPRPQKLTTH